LDICWEYRRLFDEIKPGSVKGQAHKIELDTARELKAKIYPLRNESQKEAARAEIRKLLEGGMIKEVRASAFQAPIVMAPKKSSDGRKKWRFCCDFRLLNEHSVSDKYPMPSLEHQLDIGKARFFTKMDLASAFWQIPIAPEDQIKTTFHFEGRSYMWLVMPFGLKNAPPTFQRLVDKVLSDLLGRGVYAYIDDILIYTRTLEEHFSLLREVLARLQAAGLKISLEKSEWLRKEVHYLGYIIGEGVLKMDPSKVDAITKIPLPPETKKDGHYQPNLRKQVRRFLGAAGFYRRFIRDFASLTAPLADLTKTTERIKWTAQHTQAWQTLQQCMASYPILRQVDPAREFFVDTDASNVGLGAALMQKGDDGVPYPVAYASRKLTPVERTYSTREQEALAIVFAIEKFDCFLDGRRLTVVTDHRSLSWLMTQPLVKGRLANWAYKLRSHDFTIVYRKGSENHLADFLSRTINMVKVHLAQVPTGEPVGQEAKRIVALRKIFEAEDKGLIRRSLPSRTLFRSLPKLPKGRPNGARTASAGGLQVVAHPVFSYPQASFDRGGERSAGVLPCFPAEVKDLKGQAPSTQSKEKADHKKWLRLTPEEQRRVQDWIIPGLESWRMRLRSDAGIGPLLQYLNEDPSLGPKHSLADFKN
jgi:hypothetical protein